MSPPSEELKKSTRPLEDLVDEICVFELVSEALKVSEDMFCACFDFRLGWQ
jgi:hypothetical protein